MANIKLLLIVVCVMLNQVLALWKGNIESRRICRYKYKRVCAYNTWQACCLYKTVRVPDYYTKYYCLPGWRHNGDQNCNKAICNPGCKNGGNCIKPNVCKCSRAYSGPTCEGQLCSHLRPCYPGKCTKLGSESRCSCSTGFQYSDRYSGCRELIADYQKPEIYQCQIRISNYNNMKNMEMYGLLLDTSDNSSDTDEVWTNRLHFNALNYTGIAYYDPENLPPIPSDYISEAKLGIVAGIFTTDHKKASGRSASNLQLSCKDSPSKRNPKTGIFNCSANNPTFDTRIDSGDVITVTFSSKAGGFRRLKNIDTNGYFRTQYFEETSMSKSLTFKFDTDRPSHCYPNCINDETPFDIGPEYRKDPELQLQWNGWNDALSGVQRYAWEIFRLLPNSEGELKEPKPLEPIIIREVEHTSNIKYPVYNLTEPGLYSLILQIADKANNSEYVRRFCLFDPDSSIDVSDDFNFRLRVSSASPDSNNTWQADVNGSIDVDWTSFFYNEFIEDNLLLNKILEYPIQFIEEGLTEYKKIADKYKKREGRTEEAVANRRGIVAFQIAFHQDSNGGRNQPTIPTLWTNLSSPISTQHTLDVSVSNGDTVVIWVKAIDPFGNERIEQTSVNFDSSAPIIDEVSFVANYESSGQSARSGLKCVAKDMDSGILLVSWTAERLDTKGFYNNGTITWPQLEKCSDIRQCMCLDKFGQCFQLEAFLEIDNCDLMRGLPEEPLGINLYVDIMNQAMVPGNTKIFKIHDISQLTGFGSCHIASTSALSGGGAAGISLFIIFLLAIAFLAFLFVTNRRPFTKDVKDRGYAWIRERINRQETSPSAAFKNNIYKTNENYDDDEDLYLYGGMEFDKSQSWEIPHSQLTLLGNITIGKFAKINQARIKSNSEIVVAKMLKDHYTEEEELFMRAKVNFLATQVGKHRNILEFIGAVIDNPPLGPVIITEYCECGQMDKWLITQRGKVTPETLEKLQRLAFGICQGMTYLASKTIVHKKLAARNVLLTFLLDPKITGFGPSKATEDEDENSKERIPIKWTAPECLESLKKANQKSDVWSYGIVLWEIFSLGEAPYSEFKSREVEKRVKDGYRLTKPEFCENFLYEIMKNCWQDNPKKRRDFHRIEENISKTYRDNSGDDLYLYK